MKVIFKCFIILFVFVVVSCRETKKEENSSEIVNEDIEKVESKASGISEEIDQSSQELEKEVEELEDAVKELN